MKSLVTDSCGEVWFKITPADGDELDIDGQLDAHALHLVVVRLERGQERDAGRLPVAAEEQQFLY